MSYNNKYIKKFLKRIGKPQAKPTRANYLKYLKQRLEADHDCKYGHDSGCSACEWLEDQMDNLMFEKEQTFNSFRG